MHFRLLLSLAVVTSMWSCAGDGADSSNGAGSDSTQSSQGNSSDNKISDMADFKFHTMIANLPSPLETFHIISAVDIDFDQVKLTPTKKASELSTVSARAYGYGVYITDMGCMAYQNQNQLTLDYFQVCRELASQLGAGEVFDRTITANFEENSSNEEQFIKMMDEAFDAMDQYMVDNERFVNATEIFVGSWVESQIIATHILKGRELTENTRPVYDGIYSQKKHASNLMNVLGEIDEEVEIEVLSAVEDIMMFYAGFSSIENISQEDLVVLEEKLNTLKNLLLA